MSVIIKMFFLILIFMTNWINICFVEDETLQKKHRSKFTHKILSRIIYWFVYLTGTKEQKFLSIELKYCKHQKNTLRSIYAIKCETTNRKTELRNKETATRACARVCRSVHVHPCIHKVYKCTTSTCFSLSHFFVCVLKTLGSVHLLISHGNTFRSFTPLTEKEDWP